MSGLRSEGSRFYRRHGSDSGSFSSEHGGPRSRPPANTDIERGDFHEDRIERPVVAEVVVGGGDGWGDAHSGIGRGSARRPPGPGEEGGGAGRGERDRSAREYRQRGVRRDKRDRVRTHHDAGRARPARGRPRRRVHRVRRRRARVPGATDTRGSCRLRACLDAGPRGAEDPGRLHGGAREGGRGPGRGDEVHAGHGPGQARPLRAGVRRAVHGRGSA